MGACAFVKNIDCRDASQKIELIQQRQNYFKVSYGHYKHSFFHQTFSLTNFPTKLLRKFIKTSKEKFSLIFFLDENKGSQKSKERRAYEDEQAFYYNIRQTRKLAKIEKEEKLQQEKNQVEVLKIERDLKAEEALKMKHGEQKKQIQKALDEKQEKLEAEQAKTLQNRVANRRMIENQISSFKSKEGLQAENDAYRKQLAELKKIKAMQDNPEWKKEDEENKLLLEELKRLEAELQI